MISAWDSCATYVIVPSPLSSILVLLDGDQKKVGRVCPRPKQAFKILGNPQEPLS
jgi:hypothetical protein